MDRQPESDLLAQLRAGRREAYEWLVRTHHAPIYRLLLHLTADPGRAEELTCETFSAAWEGLPHFRGQARLSTWLHGIAYRKFVADWRRRRARRGPEDHLRVRGVPPGAAQPLDRLLADERDRQLYEVTQCLPLTERCVVFMHYLQGLSLDETARILGKPVGTVKWRVNCALRHLRDLLTKVTSYECTQ
jgi:RNA polymerase sigma-70 factor (ECF subfamily)